MRWRIVRIVSLLAALGGFAPGALAATVCVSNTAALRTALANWQTARDQTYTIKLVQGTYLYPNRDYWTQDYYGGNASLKLLGGYTANCASRAIAAANTVIDGQQATSNSQFQVLGEASILVEGITFKSLTHEVMISSESDDAATNITVRNVIGKDLFGAPSSNYVYGGFRILGYSNIRVESSLFHDVHGGNTASALEVTGLDDGVNAVVTNVTAAYNEARGLSLACVECSGLMRAYNTILYNNAAGDLDTRKSDPSSMVLIAYSDFDPAKSTGTYNPVGNIKADPKFSNPLNGSFDLLANSPAINIGAPEFLIPGGYGSKDVAGSARVVGSQIDMGAYESGVDDLGTQVVTSGNDNAFDETLRAAINTANSNADATAIKFNIAGACPRIITLSTPLPDIAYDTTIDGFSQPGAKANTQYGDYDGQICLIVRAANATVSHALRVNGSGRLTLKGIEFEGFATAAVRLSAGNGNVMTGNGFAAMPGSAANAAGVRIDGTANHSLIGGFSPASRNVFNQGTVGVDFEGNGTGRTNTVQGNYFGFNFDGSPWAGAKLRWGIYVAGSGGNDIGYNAIGGLSDNGIRLTGTNTTGNVLTTNDIGIAPDGSAAGNGNAGIGIANGAHDNVIGTAAFQTQSGGGNYIVNNFGPGIWLENTAGEGNRINGNNTIFGNSDFLAIDLAAPSDGFGLGPTANDADDADSGPNRLENYPYITQARRTGPGQFVINGYLLPEKAAPMQTYRVDVFWTDACVGSGPNDTPRGEPKRHIGFIPVMVGTNTAFKALPTTTLTGNKGIPGTGYVFATATDGAGNTSEPGKCVTIIDDYIFRDGFGS